MPSALPISTGPAQSRQGLVPDIRTPHEAAQAFEGLLLKQLMSEMSKTVGDSGLFGGGFEGDMYGDMFVDALATEASKGGIGLARIFEQSMGIEERSEPISPIAAMASRIRAMSAYAAPETATRSALPVMSSTPLPLASDISSLASRWLEGPAAQRWGKEGALTRADVEADISTSGKDGTAVFNVLDANGYEGYPKCNIFSLELLRRAGYAVPVQAREHGWGYPGAETVTNAAASGRSRDWAVQRTNASVEELSQMADRGTPLLLAGSGHGDVMGHMAVAERIHSIKRNSSGEIVSIEYSGWEAGGTKAGYGHRTWHVAGEPGPGRGGLERIEILEALPASQAGTYHPVDEATPGRSWQDIESMRVGAQGSSRFPDDNRRGVLVSDISARRDLP